MCILALMAGLAIGLWYGETGKTKMLVNLVKYGKPDGAPPGRTHHPETAELRLEKTAAQVEQEYTKATIANGVEHLKALYKSEGAQIPPDKDLEAEVRDMLGRSGTPEAGIHV
jgi:hypothetical protein